MSLGDEQIDRLTRGINDAVTSAIAELREFLKGIKVTVTVTIDSTEVKPPLP